MKEEGRKTTSLREVTTTTRLEELGHLGRKWNSESDDI